MSGDKLRRLFPPGMTPIWITLTGGFGPEDQMAAFRYDHEVHRLSDFTSDQKVIQESFNGIEEIAKTRPDEPPDMLGEKGPGWLRSILSFLNTALYISPLPGAALRYQPRQHLSSWRPDRRTECCTMRTDEAAVALSSQPAERRKIVFIISDGSAYGAPMHSFKETLDLLLKNEIEVLQFLPRTSAGPVRMESCRNMRVLQAVTFIREFHQSMETAFGRITEQARNQYILTYVSNNMTDRGVFRTINVKARSLKTPSLTAAATCSTPSDR